MTTKRINTDNEGPFLRRIQNFLFIFSNYFFYFLLVIKIIHSGYGFLAYLVQFRRMVLFLKKNKGSFDLSFRLPTYDV